MKLKRNPLAKSSAQIPQTHIFCQLAKVDVVNRMIHGRAVQEVPDAAGEIFDYATSKPYFEAWSAETSEATKGKSLGNVRAMHGNVAAGKISVMTFHDDERAIDISVKVVDDNEWKKVQEGVYTGFSIGGSYVGEKVKDGELMRYTAAPIEISLVDKPCIPTSMFFDVVKSKGFIVVTPEGEEKRAFKLEGEGDPDTEVVKDEDVEIEGDPADAAALATVMQTEKIGLGQIVKLAKAQISAMAPKRFADKSASKYPLDNNEQVLAAWMFSHSAAAAKTYDTETLEAMRGEIKEAYVERFGTEPEVATTEKVAKFFSGEALQKSFYQVGSVASLLQTVAYFMGDMEYYEQAGTAPTGVTAKVMVAVQALGDVIAMFLAEAIAEEGDEETKKALEANVSMLVKAGARNSKTDASRIQKAHDMMLELGAKCAAEKVAPPDDLAKSLSSALARIDKLESQPRPARAVLRVVSKEDDTPPSLTAPNLPSPIMKKDGTVDEVASLIKFMHQRVPAAS